jgi:hypothetical protein
MHDDTPATVYVLASGTLLVARLNAQSANGPAPLGVFVMLAS